MLVTNTSTPTLRFTRTHQRIQDNAARLFMLRGFDNVTVEEVAEAAGVSHMTFYRHFPTKESVVLDDPYDNLIGAAVASQHATIPALDRVCLGILEAWNEMPPSADEAIRQRVRLAAAAPSLRAGISENNRRTENIIVDTLMGSGVTRLEARVAAGAVLGALTSALFDWAEDEDSGAVGDRVRIVVEQLLGDGGAGTDR